MSDTKRLFISLPLPLELRADLASYQEEWLSLPVRWIAEHDLHITLLFLGETPVASIPDVIEALHEVAQSFAPPRVDIVSLRLGPPGNRKSMIWATGSGTHDVHRALATNLGERGVYRQPMKRFTTHITIGRIERGVKPGPEFDIVNAELQHSFEVDRMELKESELTPAGAQHAVMETVSFIKEA